MVFSSLIFLFRFLPAFLTIYLLTKERYRNLVLFLASLVFYAWGEPVYIGLMLFSTVLDYANGRVLEYARAAGQEHLARGILAESVLINLSLLGVFKYSGVLPLPIGISFYTFQTMSYTIDVYRGEVPAQRDLAAFGAYVSMFPQLIAGPIVKYKDVAKDLENRSFEAGEASAGIGRFCIGLGKKVLLANQIGLLWEAVQQIPPGQMSTLTAWVGSAAYALQLYFDFSGYSDMAIGLGRMLGFHFPENFNYPYISKSITEFWRRWHISLGTWFRNRKGKLCQIRNLAIVWLLTGIWHGASWNFVVWGIYYGIFLIVEKVFLLKHLEHLPRFWQHVYTLLIVAVGWVIFAFDSMGSGWIYLKNMFGFGGIAWINREFVYLLYTNFLWLVLLMLGSTELPKKLVRRLETRLTLGAGAIEAEGRNVWYRKGLLVLGENIVYIVIFFVSVAYLVDATYNPFLYFRF